MPSLSAEHLKNTIFHFRSTTRPINSCFPKKLPRTGNLLSQSPYARGNQRHGKYAGWSGAGGLYPVTVVDHVHLTIFRQGPASASSSPAKYRGLFQAIYAGWHSFEADDILTGVITLDLCHFLSMPVKATVYGRKATG